MKQKASTVSRTLRVQAEERLAARQKSQEAMGCSKHSAADYKRLVHELQVHQIEMELQNEELQESRAEVEASLARLTDLYDFAPVGYISIDRSGIIHRANLNGATLLRVERNRLQGRRFGMFIAEADRPEFNDFLGKAFAGRAKESWDVEILNEGGTPTWAHLEAIVSEDGQKCRLVLLDITEKKQAEELLMKSEAFNRQILESVGDGFIVIDRDYQIVSANRSFCLQHNTTLAESMGKPCYQRSHLNDRPCWEMGEACAPRQTFATGMPHTALHTHPVGPEKFIYVQTRSFPLKDSAGEVTAVIEVIEDITEKRSLEEQYRQAQKMESVGRLAGGVAHDFNNMLLVIMGYADMAMSKVEATSSIRGDLEEIRKAANRSANLTRQLLAFARKQAAIPKILDLNEIVESMLKMLRRLLGEDITLHWQPRVSLWSVMIDPSQVDQLLANLTVNARDAILGVGSLNIETDNVSLDAVFCKKNPGCRPGDFVLLSVSDTGMGIEKAIIPNIFEPFFTTKEMGKGTGLGLATVYGIVKQNNGFIYVHSKLGKGSTFNIYLPRQGGKAEQIEAKDQSKPVMLGHETILLVEDESVILEMATKMLESLGYTVLAANTPGEALRLASNHTDNIHLLLTDVVMPEMNGRDLANHLLPLYPQLKCLFTSGYLVDVIAHLGVLDAGMHFIQKPFSMKSVAAKVRELLDSEQAKESCS
ncbi:MAG: PAS domain S-box protein [Desulfobulbaceae bacterium]|nr:PAS domain S-box protein [Desulfobulbaceae bacterium]